MADDDIPGIYLLTPPAFELSEFTPRLERVLDGAAIACLRLTLATAEEDRVTRAADTLRALAHARDIPIVVERHLGLVSRLGLDGVHLPDGARQVRAARKALGPDAIIGTFAHASRHEGMTAGDAGADYVAFGPVGSSGLGDGSRAEAELFDWWSEMIELPVIAEGGLTPALIADLAPRTDFFAIGEEIWQSEDPLTALRTLTSAFS